MRGASLIHRPGYLSVLIHQRVKLKDKKTLSDSFVKHIFQVCRCRSNVLCLPADETSFEAGVKVQIHSQDEPSFIDQFGFGVAPGFQTFVSCQEQRVQVVFVHVAFVKAPENAHDLFKKSTNLYQDCAGVV